jgi:hypothetical protein
MYGIGPADSRRLCSLSSRDSMHGVVGRSRDRRSQEVAGRTLDFQN